MLMKIGIIIDPNDMVVSFFLGDRGVNFPKYIKNIIKNTVNNYFL